MSDPAPEPFIPGPPDAPATLGDDTVVLRRSQLREAEQAAQHEGEKKKHGRAGRDLAAAVGVGVFLAVVVLGSLFVVKQLFLVVLCLALMIGAWELRTAFTSTGMRIPLIPLLVGTTAMSVLAYLRGAQNLVVTFGITVLVLLTWRAADGLASVSRDVAGSAFIALYPGFLGGFAALLLAQPDGEWRILIFILVTVFSDIGGYAVGVLWGKHPMAPSVSPKKSWEGFAGSVGACAIVGALAFVVILDAAWWAGALTGVVLAAAATVGDLIESSIKRDLGIKDMSNLLPGHGGLMDRLDSLALSLPFAWALLTFLAPAGG